MQDAARRKEDEQRKKFMEDVHLEEKVKNQL